MFNGTTTLIGKATREITDEVRRDGKVFLAAINCYRQKLEWTQKYFMKLSHKKKFLQRKAWQRSIRNHKMRSRCRHARKFKAAGVRYKGGK